MDDASTNFVLDIPVEKIKIDTKVTYVIYLLIGGSLVVFVYYYNYYNYDYYYWLLLLLIIIILKIRDYNFIKK